jgi:2-dehydro-3-deoxy-D-arabinonate dehydratase
MYLTRHVTTAGPRWALDGSYLPLEFTLAQLLQRQRADVEPYLHALPAAGPAGEPDLAPIEAVHEVWAAGVTYLRSREAREVESSVKDIYTRVYEAERPELFFKSPGWRVAGHRAPIRLRADSRWNVPEPELTLVVNAHLEVVGFCAGNDVSSRDIEGENPLYLPQAKVYDGSCALGPGILLAGADEVRDLPVRLDVARGCLPLFTGDTRTSRMKRSPGELVAFLGRELSFPHGVFLMTGTGIVPPADFSLAPGDLARVVVGALTLENEVSTCPSSQR